MSPLLLLLAALPPQGDYGYTLELNDAPVAHVTLEVGQRSLVYRRTFYFSRSAHTDKAVFKLPEKARLASFELLTPLKPGCFEARDESSSKHGQLCVTQGDGETVKGTLFGDAFTATYDAGVLVTLELPGSKYVRGLAKPNGDAFDKGFDIQGEGSYVVVYPDVPGQRPRKVVTMKGVKLKGNCLERAEALAKQNPDKYEVILGLVEDHDRMWPHAWVFDNDARVYYDPTLPDAEDRNYLQFPRTEAGQAYVKLLGNYLQLMRVAEHR